MALSLIIQRRLNPQMGGLVCSGIPGRFAPDWVADLKRNQWPVWTGILNWPVFKDYFPDQAWVSSRIKESERSRNVIAHTNDLASEEGARLEMHLRDWINQIG